MILAYLPGFTACADSHKTAGLTRSQSSLRKTEHALLFLGVETN